jgi:lambda family phage portal protein
MNPFQTAIAKLFKIPVRQAKRNYAGARRDGVSVSGWFAGGGSADSEIWSALSTLRDRSWDLYRNDPNVSGALNDIVSETVGQGILLQSKVSRRRGAGLDLKLNTAIEDAFNRWADNPKWCDAAGRMTFWKMQKTILLSVLVSGEVIVRFVRRKFDDSPIPFALQLIEADHLDETYTLLDRSPTGNKIRMGVEVDEYDRPVAYWLKKSHPGDIFHGQSYERERVLASEVLHIYNWRGFRPGQTRGVPALHSVILQSRNLLGYQESEIVKARIQSCIGAFFENEQADELALPQDDDGFFYRQLEPGMMEDLPPGKRLVPFDPSSPNPNMPDFIRTMQRAIARGMNTASYLVSGDLADANYSSMRVGMLGQRKQFEILRDDLNEDFNHKIFQEFLFIAGSTGYLSLPADGDRRFLDFYCKDCWVGAPWPWIDPLKDTKARQTELEMGTTTVTRILAEKGVDIEEHYAELAREKELRLKYGIEETAIEEPIEEPPPIEPDTVPSRDIAPKRLPRKTKKRLRNGV